MPYRTASAIFSPDRLSWLNAHSVTRLLRRSRLVWVLLFASLMLSGCVKSEVDINFESPNRGAIVQHIRLDERLTSFSSGTAKTWLDNIEKRVRRVQGNTRRLSNQEILVTIPFGNGEELETRFNEFFSPDISSPKARSAQKELDLPQLDSHLDVQQGNFLLLQRHRLIYDLDLRSLGVLASDGTLLASPGSLLELEFGLTTPWGARSINNRSKSPSIATHREGKQLIWTLQPGQNNHLEAVFWLPNPLGIGTVIIVAIVAGGIYLRRALPMPTSPPLASNS
ncbi:MAG: DUF3153 domain-containing protein [Phormidesmis sp. CAN_BIN36]|nr:DUF3153 domain-containing protein [Phormidesmis sp. CAN_BIN36]